MKFSFKLEDIKYVKITYKNNNGSTETVKAAMKEINEKEILICTKYKENFYIDIPQEIDFSVICNDGIYKTKTILKSSDNQEPYVFIILETPVGIEYQQNREYFRVPVTYNCTYRIYENNENIDYSATVYDISANGVSLMLPEHIISENLSDLIINFDGIEISLRAKYVRSEKLEKGYKISFSYVNISELDRDFISQICIKKQLEQQKNRIR